MPWGQSLAAANDTAVVFPAVYDDKSLPPTPHGLPPPPRLPPTIAQLAMPSPDESSSSDSTASHEIVDLTRYNVASPRRPNRLRKPPPSSFSLFSFIPENPPSMSNFPYIFHRSTPSSPAQSFVAGAGPARASSMHVPSASRKLTKSRRRTTGSTPPASAAADLSMARISEIPPVPPLASRSSFGFLRRKKTSIHSGADSPALPDLPPSTPLTLNIVRPVLFFSKLVSA
ncbi:hypothetical protein B0H16DRAFT_36734 [Mycena metata]|uniref:Uncharacterized protein n=1 Tax=Mycena metata TaxID=1033252 RepID=A0AAD7P340_9AGAR|nr:hypothetical protein B0H16DRAFT_36734 [Mycena metata]